MIAKVRSFVIGIAACLILVLSALAYADCNQPGNLLSNCNFDSFTGAPPRQVAQGWTPWATMGDPAFDQDNHGSAPGAPAQRIWSDGGAWTAGLYQQVQAVPGKGYKAWIEWSPFAPTGDSMERKLGIDPNGGTDPSSPAIVWGPALWDDVKMGDCHVNAYAKSTTITLFISTHNPSSGGAEQVFLDSVILVEDPSMVPPTKEPTATPTRRPPTNTPEVAAVVPTDTPLPSDTPLPTDTPTLTPTQTLTPTFTATATAIPSATPTSTPTWTPTPRPVQAGAAIESGELRPVSRLQPVTHRALGPERWLLFAALAAVVVAILISGVIVVLWLRGYSNRAGK